MSIGGVPSQGESAKWNFEGGSPSINGGGSSGSLLVGRKREVLVAVGVFPVVAVFASQIGWASENLGGKSVGTKGPEKVGGSLVGKNLFTPWIIDTGEFVSVVGDVKPDGSADLAEVRLASGGFRFRTNSLQGGGKHSCQHGDDRDYGEKLNKGKSILAMDGAGNGIILPSEMHVFPRSLDSAGIFVRGSFSAWHGRSPPLRVPHGLDRS